MTPRHRAGALLAVLLVGQFMANVDTSIVNVAAPAIHRGLGTSGSALQLIVSGYVLAYSALLITGARIGALRGHRRAFVAGLAGFTAASLACGLAPGAGTLIAARVVQGASAALMVPQVLSGIQLNFAGAERTRALGWYVATLSGSAVLGQVLGGAIVSADILGSPWRPVFLVNVPIGVALLAVATRALPADAREAQDRLDLGGVASLSAAVLLVTLPLVFGREHHWPAWTFACLLAAAPAAVLFVRTERRVAARGGRPLVDLDVLRRRAVSWGLAANVAATSTYFSMLFVLALYLQQGLGKTPLYSGSALVSWVAAFGVAGPLLRRVPARIQAHAAPIGMVVLASAYAVTAAVVLAGQPGGAPLMALLGFGGLGLGLGFGSLLRHITAALPARLAPDVSGLVTTSSQLAGALGVATFGTAYLAFASHAGRATAIDAFAGVCCMFAGAAALAAVAAARCRRSAAREQPATEVSRSASTA